MVKKDEPIGRIEAALTKKKAKKIAYFIILWFKHRCQYRKYSRFAW